MKEHSKIDVLDKGRVVLVDYMGSDSDIAQAARVSYSKGTKKLNDDKNLIHYLIKHKHETPIEMVQLKFYVKLPLFVFGQWVRHRMSSYNVVSYRYSEISEEYYIPDESRITGQSKTNKQGSSVDVSKYSKQFCEYLIEKANKETESYNNFVYKDDINEDGVSRELARIGIGQNLYTEFIWSVNLRSLFNFLNLRMDDHAQFEIREYANAIYELVKPIVPIAMEGFNKYIRHSNSFSSIELSLLKQCLNIEQLTSLINSKVSEKELSKREASEFLSKFVK